MQNYLCLIVHSYGHYVCTHMVSNKNLEHCCHGDSKQVLKQLNLFTTINKKY